MAVTALSGQRWQGTASPNCATFNGSNAVITGLGNLMSGSGAYSFSVWFRHVTGGGNDGMFSPDGTLELFGYQVSSGKMFLKMDSSATVLYSGVISNDTWYHAVGTKDDSDNIKFYINGSEVTTGSSSGSVASDSWRFGYAHTTEFWAGNAIEFAVWNGRALTLAEVQSIYGNGGSTAKKIPDATLNVSGTSYTEDLTGYYPMDTDFDKFAGTGGTNGVISGSATVDNSSPATPIPAQDDKATLLTSVYPDGLGSATDGANGSGTAITIETDTSVPSGLDTDTCWSGTATDNRITLGTSGQPLTAGTNDYTVAFWFKLDNNTETQEIVRWGVSGSTAIEAFHYATGVFACQGGEHTGLSASTWYHGAVVRDGSNGILYLDGDPESTNTLPVIPTVSSDDTSCNLMGRKIESEGTTGNMKEVGFWNRALSSAEITSLVGNKGSTAKKVPEVSTTGLTTYFSCDTIAPNIADSSTKTSNLPENTIFNETDTYKYFMLDGTDTWNQMVSS